MNPRADGRTRGTPPMKLPRSHRTPAWLVAASAALLAGCGQAGASGGTFRGTYVVPTAPGSLAAAATFAVPEVEWTISGGVAELAYDLPLGLVGKDVRVTFSGPYQDGATSQLVGPPGTAACDAAAASVSCFEEMGGLKPLAPDLAVVEQLAAVEYAGPAADRVQVAQLFAADPIGVVEVDLGQPVGPEVEDKP